MTKHENDLCSPESTMSHMASFCGKTAGAGGFTLIEMMLVLIVVMSLMTLELKRKSAEMNEHAAIAAGRHMKTVADATNAYLVNNYGPLMAGTDPNCLPAATWPCYLNPAALVSQQILPASFVLKTAWDSDYSIAVTRVGASPYYNLNGIVLSVSPWTSDGTPAGAPKLSELGRAVVEMGPDGGFSMTATEVSGLKGGWSC